jgi:tetratricopeptide (TPR) repeat protein
MNRKLDRSQAPRQRDRPGQKGGARTGPQIAPWRNPLMWLGAGGLVALVLVVYWPTLRNGYIWDDETYVEHNVNLQSASGLYAIWFKIGAVPQYYPLVHTTFWIENHLWGIAPRGYHFVNLSLHAASAILLWRLLLRLRVPGAWLAAAIFAVHPVQVETVAWITERKNVLSCLLGLGAIWSYLKFSPPEATDAQRAGDGPATGGWWYYGLALALYVLGLLSKTVVCSVPAVLLVIYWWKRGRLSARETVRLAPFFVIGLSLAALTVWMERTRVLAVGAEWDYTPMQRILLAGRDLWFYAEKLAWPHPLMFFYPRWEIRADDAWQYLYLAAALIVFAGLWAFRARIGRGPLAAALIFAGVLVPALGFFNVYPFRFSFVADHFQYHASIALIALAAAGITLVCARLKWRGALPLVAIVIIGSLAVVAQQRTRVYHDLKTLYEDTIAQNPACWIAHHNLGSYLEDQGKYPEAIEHYREAARLDPDQSRLKISLAVPLFVTNQLDEAEAQLNQALASEINDIDRSDAWLYLGNIRTARRQYPEAFAAYEQAITARPENDVALYFHGVALGANGDTEGAIEKLLAAIRLNPNYSDAHHKLGQFLSLAGRRGEAIREFEEAVRLAPTRAVFRIDLGNALFNAHNVKLAEEQIRTAIQLDPQNAESYNTLGAILGSQNDLRGAIVQFQMALRMKPGYVEASNNLQRALEAQRRSP